MDEILEAHGGEVNFPVRIPLNEKQLLEEKRGVEHHQQNIFGAVSIWLIKAKSVREYE